MPDEDLPDENGRQAQKPEPAGGDETDGFDIPFPDDTDGADDPFPLAEGDGRTVIAPLPGPSVDDDTDRRDPPHPVPEDDDLHAGLAPAIDPSPDHTVIVDSAEDMPDVGYRTIIDRSAPPPSSSPPAPPKLVEPGTLINNNYRIEELISAGGMGEVYRAVNVYTGDPVAVKVILPELARDQDIIDLFRREARVLVQLRDDAIVSYHNFVLDQGLNRYCLIMEFVEGTHLGTLLRAPEPMPDDQCATLLARLARGLGRAHARGVTHRDLSPDNVILRHDRVEEAVLIDFGIARSTELGDGLAGRFAGKFKYIAPEQLGHFDGVVGPQTDIYGLALLVIAMLRGKPLEMGDSVVSASDARRRIPDLSGVSHRMFPLLQYMLEPDPAARPAEMGQIIAMLDDPTRIPARYRLPLWNETATQGSEAAEKAQVSGISDSPFDNSFPATGPAPIAPAPPRRRSSLPLILGATLSLALAAGLGWFLLRDEPPPDPVDPDPDPVPQQASLPARDPASRDGFLAGLPLGDCAMAQRVASGPAAGTVEIFANAAPDSAALQDAYETAFGTRPAVTARGVDAAQCPVLDFAATLAGRSALPPEITSKTSPTAAGFAMEARIAGLDGRNLWLTLIAPDGSVYDLTAQSVVQPDGSVDAGIAVDPPGGTAALDAPYLLLAVTSSDPLVSIAAAPAGAEAARLLPAVLDELRSDGAAAAASVTRLAMGASDAGPVEAQTQDEAPAAE